MKTFYIKTLHFVLMPITALLFTLAAAGCPSTLEECTSNDECIDSSGCFAGQTCSSLCVCEGDALACGAPGGPSGDCETDTDCGGATTCQNCNCACPAASECVSDDECTDNGEFCSDCACIVAWSIPPNTTGCTLDADGCLAGGSSTCNIELDGALVGATGTVLVNGVLLDASPMTSTVHLIPFGETNGYEFTGYGCSVGRDGTTADRVLNDVNRTLQATDSWTVAAGDYPVAVTCAFDSSATSAGLSVAAAGAPATVLESTTMGAANSTVVAVAVRNGKVCNVVVTQP